MSVITITSSNGNSVAFSSSEATDTGFTKPFYSINRGAEESAGGVIKQQIRPGKRFNKSYRMKLSESKYIDFMNMLTDQSDDFYITYGTDPSLLSNDSEIPESNNFKISLNIDPVDETLGDPLIYGFNMSVQSINLL